MNKLILKVELRNVFGKKLKKTRKQGTVPGNIYGQDFKSTAVSFNLKDFINVYKVSGETGIVYLSLKEKEVPTLIKNLQKHPVTDKLLHVDFRKIDLKKKVETEVPVKVVGVSEAVTQKAGVLLLQSETLLVETLPEDIPSHFKIDISQIKEIGQEIKVDDLKKSDRYEIKTPAEKVVVSVIAHKEESVTPETTAAAPEILTEKEEEA
jgi:large subunit ribosomal protein L25